LAIFICAFGLVTLVGIAGVILLIAYWGPAAVGSGIVLVGLSAVAGWVVLQARPPRGELLVIDEEGLYAASLGRFVPWKIVGMVRAAAGLGGVSLEISPHKSDRRIIVPLGHLQQPPRVVTKALLEFAPRTVAVGHPHGGWQQRLPAFALAAFVLISVGLASFTEGNRTVAAAHNVLGNIYLKGVVVQQDPEQAAAHYRKAAAEGSLKARIKLDVLERRHLDPPSDPL
jgi:hypothetical protein